MTEWTYETLTNANRATLEQVLQGGPPPDPEVMVGHAYEGWNDGLLAYLSGKKFKKVFIHQNGRVLGYNEKIRQTGGAPSGKWEVVTKNGDPVLQGYFDILLASEGESLKQLIKRYPDKILFNYDTPINSGAEGIVYRMIRDFAALPNPGDHSLILGKAYLRILGINIFWSYFVLGNRQQISN